MRAATIVFARTYHVDYRFLATPEGFTADDVRMLEPIVDQAIATPHLLETTVRWISFRLKNHLILGCSSLVRPLLGDNSPYSRDAFDRDILAFVGVVFPQPCPEQFPTDPPLGQMAELLREQLERQWLTPVVIPAFETSFAEIAVTTERLVATENFPRTDGVGVWPDRGSENWELIRTTAASSGRSAMVGAPRPPVSDPNAENETLFTDVVVAGKGERYVIRPSEPPSRTREDSMRKRASTALPILPHQMLPAREPTRPTLPSSDLWIVVGGVVIGGLVSATAKVSVLLASAALGGLAGLGIVAYKRSQSVQHTSGATQRQSRTTAPAERTPSPRKTTATDRSSSDPTSASTTSWTTSSDATTRSKTWK